VGGVTHRYEVSMRAGEFASLLVDQRATDLAVTVFDPSAGVMAEFDGRWHGAEPVFVRSSVDGVYRIEVKTVLNTVLRESYQVAFETARETVDEDDRRLKVTGLATESKKLVTRATAATLQTAVKNYQELLPLLRALRDRSGEAAALNSLGFAMSSLGRFEEALGHYQSSLGLWRELRYERGEGETLLNIGAAYSSMGEKRTALAHYDHVLAIDRRLQDRRAEMYVVNNIASVMGDLGEPRSALARFGQVLELATQLGDQVAVARTLVNMSTAHQSLGEFQQALGLAERALNSAPSTDLRGRAVVLTRLGDLYFLLGDHARARDSYSRAIELAQAGGDPRIRAFTTLQLSMVHREVGELDEAFARVVHAQALAEEIQDRRTLAMSLIQRAELHRKRAETEPARESFRQAVAHSRAVGDPRSEALAHLGLGVIDAELGDRPGARETLEHALALVRSIGDRSNEARILLARARLDRDDNALDLARTHAEAALKVVEAIRGEVVNQHLRTGYTASTHDFYELGIDVLMRLHARNGSAGFDRMALELSERSRARRLVELLNEARADIRQGVEPSLLSRERSLRELVNTKAERLLALAGNRQAARAASALEGELEEAVARLRDVEAEIRSRSPRFSALALPQPLRASEIQDQVDPETVLLVYSLGESRSYLWAITPTGLSSLTLPPRGEIEQAARRVHELITVRVSRRPGETAGQWGDRVAVGDAEYGRASSALSRMILGPLLAQLNTKRVVVVAEGALQFVPFSALPIPGSIDGRPLLSEYEVASIPSVSSLAELRREARTRQRPPRTLAILADPVFSNDDPRVGGAASRPSASAADQPALWPRDLDRAAADVAGASGVRFARLPFSRREADAAVRYVRPAERLRAVDFDASYATATSPDLAQYRFVHFATHGLLDSVRPELSGLVFSLVGRDGSPQQGYLRAHEVYNLRLPADLVVLSGCRTGLGRDIKGEGMVSLARGFLYAGAQRVSVSLWQVDDEATAELMSRFYAAMIRDGMRPTAALRSAQLALRDTRRWRVPFYWAGFVLQGEWR
jgi:CHAT domain-containing protein/tetratricopeptide (TPR) repeat protein